MREQGAGGTEQGANDFAAPYALCGDAKVSCTGRTGFTLLEVMIAMAVFFIVVFAVLGMVVQSLGAARNLQLRHADAGMLAAELSLTNALEEGCESGDFGELYPDYQWERCQEEAATNGLYRVTFVVIRKNASGKAVSEEMTVLMYKPGNPAGFRRVR